MDRKPHPDLAGMLSFYNETTVALFYELRLFILEQYPETNELIYDAYSAVSIAFSLSDKLSDAYCHLPIYKSYVNLGFNRGAELNDPDKILQGKGKSIRHIKVPHISHLPKAYATELLQQAIALAMKDLGSSLPMILGQALIKSVSEKKKRP